MPSLPTLSGKEVVKAFSKDGWELARQRGSHMILVKVGLLPRSQCRIIEKWPLAPCGA